jgi:hypothetical protein
MAAAIAGEVQASAWQSMQHSRRAATTVIACMRQLQMHGWLLPVSLGASRASTWASVPWVILVVDLGRANAVYGNGTEQPFHGQHTL